MGSEWKTERERKKRWKVSRSFLCLFIFISTTPIQVFFYLTRFSRGAKNNCLQHEINFLYLSSSYSMLLCSPILEYGSLMKIHKLPVSQKFIKSRILILILKLRLINFFFLLFCILFSRRSLWATLTLSMQIFGGI